MCENFSSRMKNPKQTYICILCIHVYWSVTESTSSNCHTLLLSVELQQLSMSVILHPGSVYAHYWFLWTSMSSMFPYDFEKNGVFFFQNTVSCLVFSSFIAAMIGCPMACIPISRYPVRGLWPYNCYPDCGSCCIVVREFVDINILI